MDKKKKKKDGIWTAGLTGTADGKSESKIEVFVKQQQTSELYVCE